MLEFTSLYYCIVFCVTFTVLPIFSTQKHIASTSRLLQRWMSSWIVFIMMWCAMLIMYWVSHSTTLSGILQFLFPLAALGLITSGYAEVNFEAQRLIQYILPTEDRMPVLYYISNIPLELRVSHCHVDQCRSIIVFVLLLFNFLSASNCKYFIFLISHVHYTKSKVKRMLNSLEAINSNAYFKSPWL